MKPNDGIEIAMLTVSIAKPGGPEAQHVAAAGARRHGQLRLLLERVHLHAAAFRGEGEGDIDVGVEIEAASPETRVLGDVDNQHEIAGGGGRLRRIRRLAHAGQADAVALLDGSGDLHIDPLRRRREHMLHPDRAAKRRLLEPQRQKLIRIAPGGPAVGRARGCKQMAIVERALLRVGQHLVSLLDTLEQAWLGFGGAIGMIANREKAVSLVDQLRFGGRGKAEQFVVVTGHGRRTTVGVSKRRSGAHAAGSVGCSAYPGAVPGRWRENRVPPPR